MIFKNIIFLGTVFIYTACGLRMNELSPTVPVFTFKQKNDACSSINYEEELKKYFFDFNEKQGENLQFVFDCLYSQFKLIKTYIYNDSLTRKEIHAVLDDDFINLPDNIKLFLKKILAPDYHEEFSFLKNYAFQLIDINLALETEPLCQKTEDKGNNSLETIQEETLISKDDLDLVFDALDNLQQKLSLVEKQAEAMFENLQKHQQETFPESPTPNKQFLLYERKSFFNFIEILEQTLFQSFPNYSDFLKQQREKHIIVNESHDDSLNEESYSYHSHLYLQQELHPLFESLSVFSPENKLHLLDVKYLFMIISSIDFLFKKYDINKNQKIDDSEILALSCFIEPFLTPLIEAKLKDRNDWVKHYYRPQKILRYIFKHQEIPGPFSLSYSIFNPDKEISLSYIELHRLMNLLFELGLKELKPILTDKHL